MRILCVQMYIVAVRTDRNVFICGLFSYTKSTIHVDLEVFLL